MQQDSIGRVYTVNIIGSGLGPKVGNKRCKIELVAYEHPVHQHI